MDRKSPISCSDYCGIVTSVYNIIPISSFSYITFVYFDVRLTGACVRASVNQFVLSFTISNLYILKMMKLHVQFHQTCWLCEQAL